MAHATTTAQVFTFAELAKKENAAVRTQFGLDTAKEVREVAADLDYKDPDFLCIPGARSLRFMEVNGIIATERQATEQQRALLLSFFTDRDQTFDCVEEEELDEEQTRIAYRGGEGYYYSQWQAIAA